jgi:DegV family protein with EDD domain
MVHIVTDSTSDIPVDTARELGITVVPAHVIFDEQSYDDGITITRDEFYRRLAHSPRLPTTSAPSPGEFGETYQKIGGEIVSIHVAAAFSSILSSAYAAAQMVPEAQVTLFDSSSLAMGLGWQVILAARAAQAGQPVEQIVSVLEHVRPRVRVYAALDTLEYVRRGGRIGWARAMLGQLLSIKQIIEVRDSEVISLERVRTRHASLDRLKELIYALGPLQALAVQHTRAPDDARNLATELAARIALPEPIVICEATTAIGTHVGPNGLGLIAVMAE